MADSRPMDSATPDRTQDAMLLDFLREFDAPCPACGYSLHALTTPVCPECNQSLVLTVGAARPPIGWLLAALAPCFFSGIAACFVAIPVFGRLLFGDGLLSPAITAVDAFGFLSGAFGIILAFALRQRFIALRRSRQIQWTLAIWAIHFMALALFIALAPFYL